MPDSDAAVEYGSHKDKIARAGGAVAHQQDLTALAESSTFLAEFQPALIPGRLQTAAFMREKSLRDPTLVDDGISMEDLGQVIAARIRRQAILYKPGREFVHVVTEAALRLRIRAMTIATLRGQLTHLAELATLPGHTFGVLPFTTPCPVERPPASSSTTVTSSASRPPPASSSSPTPTPSPATPAGSTCWSTSP